MAQIKYPSDEPLSRFTRLSVLTDSPAEHKADPNCSAGGCRDGRMGGWVGKGDV